MSAHPRWRGIARALGAWPSSIRFAAGRRGLFAGDRVCVAREWGDVGTGRGGRRRWALVQKERGG